MRLFYDFQTPCGIYLYKKTKNETFFFSHLHAFFTSKAPELMNDFMIEAQRLQQSAQHNTQPSIDTTDHPEQRFVNNSFSLSLLCFSNIYYKVEVMETEEFNEDSFETETNNLMEEPEPEEPQKQEQKVKAKKKATRNSRKTTKKTSAEIVLSSDEDDNQKPDDPDYKPRMRTRSKSKKNA